MKDNLLNYKQLCDDEDRFNNNLPIYNIDMMVWKMQQLASDDDANVDVIGNKLKSEFKPIDYITDIAVKKYEASLN